VRYFVTSNEPQPPELLKEVPHYLGSNHIIEDMYALAACDYLIGVHSTYSGWASFYGRVPLFNLTDPAQVLTLDQFRVRSRPL
jgi:hypothetical protein